MPKGHPNCDVCHGSGWDGEGYSLTCRGCSPSEMDLHVDQVTDRKRNAQGILVGETITGKQIKENDNE